MRVSTKHFVFFGQTTRCLTTSTTTVVPTVHACRPFKLKTSDDYVAFPYWLGFCLQGSFLSKLDEARHVATTEKTKRFTRITAVVRNKAKRFSSAAHSRRLTGRYGIFADAAKRVLPLVQPGFLSALLHISLLLHYIRQARIDEKMALDNGYDSHGLDGTDGGNTHSGDGTDGGDCQHGKCSLVGINQI